MNLLVESVESVHKISEALKHPVSVFIKIDIGTHRTGVDPGNQKEIRNIISAIEGSKNTKWLGFLAHAGHSYDCKGKEEILAVHSTCMESLESLRNDFSDYPELVISYGDTPTCSVADTFNPVDELRVGNFAFYDLVQLSVGSCTVDQISVAMACPVVAKHPEREELIIYGGGVHFSKDKSENYGQIVVDQNTGWGNPIVDVIVSKLSQEHGTVSASREWIEKKNIGDIIKILPVHSCLTMDLMRHFSWKVI